MGLRFRHLPTKMCVLVYTDSALNNADAYLDEEGSDDEWLAKGVRVRSQHGAVVSGPGRTHASNVEVATSFA